MFAMSGHKIEVLKGDVGDYNAHSISLVSNDFQTPDVMRLLRTLRVLLYCKLRLIFPLMLK